MPQPYFLMSMLYLSLLALSWLASIATGLDVIPLFGSLKYDAVKKARLPGMHSSGFYQQVF